MQRPEGGAVVSHTDITSRKVAEMEVARLRWDLTHVARVNLMGELTASLAHELNQPLTAILSNAHAGGRILAAGALPPTEIGEILEDIAADASRAGKVIHRIRGLLKKGDFEFAPLDLGDILQDVLALVRVDAMIRKTSIHLEVPPELPLVRGDRVQLQQVLLNLIVNGLEAMESTPVQERRLAIRIGASEGPRVLVAVQDAGVGIPEEQLTQIFGPFYTSKPAGFGMGLAICRSILEAHGGTIWAVNNPGRGSTLWFSLPACATRPA
jgi:two-component system sensor kinase FixL